MIIYIIILAIVRGSPTKLNIIIQCDYCTTSVMFLLLPAQSIASQIYISSKQRTWISFDLSPLKLIHFWLYTKSLTTLTPSYFNNNYLVVAEAFAWLHLAWCPSTFLRLSIGICEIFTKFGGSVNDSDI